MEPLNIFLSWSGERSRRVARALHDWLPNVLQFAQPWMSEEADKGEKWRDQVSAQLDAADVGVICLAPDNLSSAWILFEAGALHKTARCTLPYLHGVSREDVDDPLRSFNLAEATREDTLKLVQKINAVYAAPLSEKRCGDAFEQWWPRLETRLAEAGLEPSSTSPAQAHSVRELIEENLLLTRSLHHATFAGHEALKADMAIWIAEQGNLDLTLALSEEIHATDQLTRIADALIQGGHADAEGVRRLLNLIQGMNNAELRKLAISVIDRGDADSDVLSYMVRIISNMFELRKVGIRLVDRGEHTQPIFAQVVDKLARTNRTALRDVALTFVQRGLHREPEFQRLMDDLMAHQPSVAGPVFVVLQATDPEMLAQLRRRYGLGGGGDPE